MTAWCDFLLQHRPFRRNVKINPAATVNVSGKKATRIRVRFINFNLKVKHIPAWRNVWLHFFLYVSDDFHRHSVIQQSSHIFPIDTVLKIKQRCALNCKKEQTFFLLMWPRWQSKLGRTGLCLSCWSLIVETADVGGCDQNNGAASRLKTAASHQLPTRLCGKHRSHLITFNLNCRCKTGG